MKNTPSHLPEKARKSICEALRAVLVDGLDLYTQLKVAHWNIKGPQFAALHPLFDQFATDQAANNDEVAERILTLGYLAVGTARHVARKSRLPDYPQDVTKDLDHVALLAERIGAHLEGLRAARDVAKRLDDEDTFDLLTGMVEAFEKICAERLTDEDLVRRCKIDAVVRLADLDGVHAAREVALQQKDDDTVSVLTDIVTEFEKHAWFLHATLGG